MFSSKVGDSDEENVTTNDYASQLAQQNKAQPLDVLQHQATLARKRFDTSNRDLCLLQNADTEHGTASKGPGFHHGGQSAGGT